MEKEKQDFREPEVTTYERDELVVETAITGLQQS
jgi:hypothetical protein